MDDVERMSREQLELEVGCLRVEVAASRWAMCRDKADEAVWRKRLSEATDQNHRIRRRILGEVLDG